MPLVACPKCATNLKVPDGPVPAVRCPKCQTVFTPNPPAQSGFEVVDDAPPKSAAPPPKPAAPRPAPPRSAARPAPKPAVAEADFEPVDDEPAPAKKKGTARLELDDDDDDRPRKRRRDEDYDDEDDRPRPKRRRNDDDDEDDRPRGRRRSRDDDGDDEDDRPRRKRRDDDEDDYDYSPPRKGSKLGLGRVGVLLVLISLGLYLGGLALHALFLMVAIIGGVIPGGLGLVTGILGLANWVVGLIGLGFCIAGPSKARGLAIAALSVAAVHLVLAFTVVNHRESAACGSVTVPVLSAVNRVTSIMKLQRELAKEQAKNPGSARAKELRAELKEAEDLGWGGLYVRETSDSMYTPGSGMRWHDLTTQLIYPDKLIGVLAFDSKYFADKMLLGLFCGLAELARFILIALMLGAMARAAKEYRAENKAKLGWIVGASAAGACLLIVMLTFVIADSYKNDMKKLAAAPPHTAGMTQEEAGEKMLEKTISLLRAPIVWVAVGELLCYLAHAGAVVLPALAAMQVFSATSRKGR